MGAVYSPAVLMKKMILRQMPYMMPLTREWMIDVKNEGKKWEEASWTEEHWDEWFMQTVFILERKSLKKLWRNIVKNGQKYNSSFLI